jgi:F-type H+-transporting ATPase subunit epsilon
MPDGISGKLHCLIVTPEKQLADRQADFLIMPAFDGQIGILPEHAALLCKLSQGYLRIDEGQKKNFYYISGGFAEVLDNKVIILAPQVISADAISLQSLDTEEAEIRVLPDTTGDEKEKKNLASRALTLKRFIILEQQKQNQ